MDIYFLLIRAFKAILGGLFKLTYIHCFLHVKFQSG